MPVSVLLLLASVGGMSAQEKVQASPGDVPGSISVRSHLVIVPALVKTKHGDVVFSLEATDFTVTDDGVPQRVQLEPDADSQPLALVVLAQTGGNGSVHLKDYRNLGAVLEAIVGAVPHVVSVVSFDSSVHLERSFRANTDEAATCLVDSSPEIKASPFWTV